MLNAQDTPLKAVRMTPYTIIWSLDHEQRDVCVLGPGKTFCPASAVFNRNMAGAAFSQAAEIVQQRKSGRRRTTLLYRWIPHTSSTLIKHRTNNYRSHRPHPIGADTKPQGNIAPLKPRLTYSGTRPTVPEKLRLQHHHRSRWRRRIVAQRTSLVANIGGNLR